MANVICHDGYCEPTSNREDSSKMTFSENALLVGGYVLFAIVLGVSLWYGTSQGIYIDPTTFTP